MSASAKKKLRKEQNASQLTEKQQKAKQDAKKLKLTTTIFVIVMATVLLVGLVLIGFSAVKSSGIVEKNTTALTIGEHKINAVEMNYYFNDTISSTYSKWQSEYGDYAASFISMMGLDTAKPLDQQSYDDVRTWADFFLEEAIAQAKSNYTLYDLAIAEGYTADDAIQADVENRVGNLQMTAMFSGYQLENFDDFLKLSYGNGSSEKSLRKYHEISAIAAAYYQDHEEALTYDDAAIRGYEADKLYEYNAYTYDSYYVNYKNFLPEGVEDPTDAQIDEAVAAAKAAADGMLTSNNTEAFDQAIAALEFNAENPSAASTKNKNVIYTSVNSSIQEWIRAEGRKEGDMAVLPVEGTITNDAGETVEKELTYYVVLYHGMIDNTAPMVNVRHLLVSFDKDESGNVTESANAAAKAEALSYLKDWEAGNKTEESFIALVKEHSDDGSASEGGLFENIYAGAPYVENWLNWCIDSNRKVGDCEVIESEYGYHVMYFVGNAEQSRRDQMIVEEMTAADMDAWYNGILETAVVVEGNLKHVNTDITLG